MAGIAREDARDKIMKMSDAELKIKGEQTVSLALVIVRSAVDIMLIEHLNLLKKDGDGVSAVLHETFAPLIKDFESNEIQEAFNRAFDIFSKENTVTRMATMENILQAVLNSLAKFGDLVETGKEFVDEQH